MKNKMVKDSFIKKMGQVRNVFLKMEWSSERVESELWVAEENAFENRIILWINKYLIK
jgi:hypothetical protein